MESKAAAGCVRGRSPEGLMSLCDPAAGILGGKGGGEARGRAAVAEVLASVQ